MPYVNLKDPPLEGEWLGRPGKYIVLAYLEYSHSAKARGKWGYYYINTFQTPDGNRVTINTRDNTFEMGDWIGVEAKVRQHSDFAGWRTTYLERPIRHWRVATCKFCHQPKHMCTDIFLEDGGHDAVQWWLDTDILLDEEEQ